MTETSSASSRDVSQGTPPSGSPSTQTGGGDRQAQQSAAVERSSQAGHALKTDRGTTTIASAVVAKIAGLATREIPGVQNMGTSMARTVGSIRSKMPGGSSATEQGVSVDVGERQTAVDLDIVVHYGQSIVETADAIRSNVIDRIEAMTGLEVVEVNVTVDDLYLDSGGDSSRVE